jgi:hypothetical protein
LNEYNLITKIIRYRPVDRIGVDAIGIEPVNWSYVIRAIDLKEQMVPINNEEDMVK